MIKKILIANRGEIACRIIKTCQQLGIQTVAIFSSIDKHAMFVKAADEAYPLNSDALYESYLDGLKIINIAKQANCQAIHPGYGFLSENADFATQCHDNNITFIGPSADCITQMGCKKQAKTLMQENSIPVVPGFNINSENEQAELFKKANKVGYPLLIKAASGGGGKGMKRVDSPDELINAISSAKREAIKSFASDVLLVEKYLENPRHIEVQIVADNHGNCVHVFDRDCSIQRRHQKIIEEAPAIDIPNKIRNKMHQTAIDAALAINYSGAGTIEFLLNDDEFYFMEMNTRLQVEHPVSEYISGIDLVDWQIQIANNLHLPKQQKDIVTQGHAIEVRVYAEDTDNDFLPQIGKLEQCRWPQTHKNLRIDTGVQAQDEISVNYDPMIAKVIAYAPNRDSAIYAMIKALQETLITGLTTNLAFLGNILSQSAFQQGKLSTHYLLQNPITETTSPELSALVAAVYKQLTAQIQQSSPWQISDSWQANLNNTQQHCFTLGQTPLEVNLSQQDKNLFQSDMKNYKNFEAFLQVPNKLIIQTSNHRHTFQIYSNESENSFDVITNSSHHVLNIPNTQYESGIQSDGSLNAPMPGLVVSLSCKKGLSVRKNQVLMIIEAMKMEHPIKAPYDGVIDDIFYDLGNQVNEGQPLLSIQEIKESA